MRRVYRTNLPVAFLGLLAGLTAAPLAAQTPAPPAAVPTPDRLPESFDPEGPLADTQSYARPLDAATAVRLSQELQARGFPDAAAAVLGRLTTAPADLERLGRELMAQRLYEAALPVLESWLRGGGKEDQGRLLLAATYFAQGELELAERQLNARPAGIGDPIGRLLFQLILTQRQGRLPGITDNPWQLQTELPDGTFPVGQFPEGQAGKVKAEDVQALAELLTLVPGLGHLWALLGELYNGFGEPTAALAAFDRANELGYAPPRLRHHQDTLRSHAQRLRAEAEARLAAAGATDTSSESQPNGNEPPATDWFSVVLVLVIGGGFIVFMLALQIRLWLRRK